jgi:large subunit ribosomal protein L23
MTNIFDVLRRPLVTEKTNYQVNRLHQYVFEVAVLRVNILNVPAKRTRRARSRRLMVRNAAYKKAVVTLAPEDRIPIFEGVE